MDGIAPALAQHAQPQAQSQAQLQAQPHTRTRRPAATRAAWVTVWLAGTLVASCNIAACGKRADTRPQPVDTGLASLLEGPGANKRGDIKLIEPSASLSDEQKAAWANQAALNLEAVMNAPSERRGLVTAVNEVVEAPVVQEPTTALTELTQPAGSPASNTSTETPATQIASTTTDAPSTGLQAMVSADQSALTVATPTPPTPTDPLTDIATKMAALLRQTDAAGKPLIADLPAILPIESLKPGVLATLNDAANPLAMLSTEDKQALIAARDRLLANPRGATNDLIKSLRPTSGFNILRTALCVRVEGFGRFEPYQTSTFVQGRTLRAIVYVELDGFSTRPARDSDPVLSSVALSEQASVDLTQSLSLYHDADDLLAWHRPARGVIETSRNKRHDFYLIQQVDLPPTLTVGRYNLKVTVTDRTTQAQAEAVLPIEIVAHESALRGR
ncbi:hypothetical protein LBMAG48_03550 [Phycisphaerae bacterium]|nr:hypothetical protein LBMAG48_03550 [Phycisphaerae bacterium]